MVIPSRDTAELTLSCLAALEAAAYPELEILLVDDGSTDGTEERVRARFPAVRVLSHETPRGFTHAANLGLGAARGEILLLLNSDTEIEPPALAALAAAFAADHRLGIAGARLFFPDGRPQWSGGPEPGLAWLFGLASGLPRLAAGLPGYRRLRPVSGSAPSAVPPMTVDWVTGAALALRRQVWQEVGPLDPRFRFYAQDLDLCLRARAAGWEVRVLPEVEVRHHQGGTITAADGAAGGGAVGGEHPELLWTDLLRWAAKHRGPAWARRARRLMCLGARLRLAGRDAAAFRAARRSISRLPLEASP